MRLALILSLAALAPTAHAQLAQLETMKPAEGTVRAGTGGPATVPLETIITLEKQMDSRISATGGSDPCLLASASRGLYVNGLGVVFTAEAQLAITPGGGLFPIQLTPEQKAKVLKTKQSHVPMLEQTLRDMVLSLVASPALKLGDNDQVVVAVRLWYRPWEDRTGLPGEIVARLDHRGGAIRVDKQ